MNVVQAASQSTGGSAQLRHDPEVVEVEIEGKLTLIDQRHGAVHELDTAAALTWALLDEPSRALELAERISRLTGAESDAVLADLTPLLESWTARGLLLGTNEATPPPLNGLWPASAQPGPVPLAENQCTRNLDALGWDAMVEVPVGDRRTVGLRTFGPTALDIVTRALPGARVRAVGELPANVSLRVSQEDGEGGRVVALAYQACTLVGRSRQLGEALAAALRAVADEARLGTQHDEHSVLLDSTALLGPRGGVLLGPAFARHWMAGRSSQLKERGVSLLPRYLRVLPGCRVAAEAVALPGSATDGVDGLQSLLEASGPMPVSEVHWAAFGPADGSAVSEKSAALASLAASAGPITSEQMVPLIDLVHGARLNRAGFGHQALIDRASML